VERDIYIYVSRVLLSSVELRAGEERLRNSGQRLRTGVGHTVLLPWKYGDRGLQKRRRRIALANKHFNWKKKSRVWIFNLQLKKSIVKAFGWSIAMYGSETWTNKTFIIIIFLTLGTPFPREPKN